MGGDACGGRLRSKVAPPPHFVPSRCSITARSPFMLHDNGRACEASPAAVLSSASPASFVASSLASRHTSRHHERWVHTARKGMETYTGNASPTFLKQSWPGSASSYNIWKVKIKDLLRCVDNVAEREAPLREGPDAARTSHSTWTQATTTHLPHRQDGGVTYDCGEKCWATQAPPLSSWDHTGSTSAPATSPVPRRRLLPHESTTDTLLLLQQRKECSSATWTRQYF